MCVWVSRKNRSIVEYRKHPCSEDILLDWHQCCSNTLILLESSDFGYYYNIVTATLLIATDPREDCACDCDWNWFWRNILLKKWWLDYLSRCSVDFSIINTIFHHIIRTDVLYSLGLIVNFVLCAFDYLYCVDQNCFLIFRDEDICQEEEDY